MKRCPQCEFTFNDDQYSCDFDAAELSAILEPRPAPQNFSVLIAVSTSLVPRLLRSNFSLAGLALAGIVLSALLVGYYSATDAESKGETEDSLTDLASAAPDSEASFLRETQVSTTSPVSSDQAPVKTPARAHAKTKTSGTLTKRRTTKATRNSSSLTSSMVARRSAAFRSRARFRSSTHKVEATSRKYAEPEFAMRPAVDGSSKQLLAKNQKQPGSPEQNNQELSAAGMGNTVTVTNGQRSWAGRESAAGRESVVGSGSGKAPQKKESKVIAVLKKTGRILTRPFRF